MTGRVATTGFEIPVTAGADAVSTTVVVDPDTVGISQAAANALFINIINRTCYHCTRGDAPWIVWRDIIPDPVAGREIITIPDNRP